MPADLSNPLLVELCAELRELESDRSFADGEELYHCGDAVDGVYLVVEGRVSLWLECERQQPRRFDEAEPGALLGLSEVLSGDAYKLTARAAGEVHAGYVRRDDLLDYLRKHPACCMHVVRLLSEDLNMLYGKYCSMEDDKRKSRKKPSAEPPKVHAARRVH